MKIFLDTAPIIYLIEGHEQYADIVIEKISEGLDRGDTYVTSVITIMEFSVKPEKEERSDVLNQFYEF